MQTEQNRKGVSGWKLTKNKPDPSVYHLRGNSPASGIRSGQRSGT